MRKLLIPLSLLAALGLIGGIYANWFKRYPSILQTREAFEKWADKERWAQIFIVLEHFDIYDNGYSGPLSEVKLQNRKKEILDTFPEAEITQEFSTETIFRVFVPKRWCVQEKETNQFLGSQSFFVHQNHWSANLTFSEAKGLKGDSEVKKNFRCPIQK